MAPELVVILAPAALLIGAALQIVFARLLTPKQMGILAALSAMPALFGVLSLGPLIQSGGVVDFRLGTWGGPAQLAYHVDGLGFFFAFMASAIGSAVLVYSIHYMQAERGLSRFYALLLLYIAGLIHLVFSVVLVLLFVCWVVV